MGLTSLFKLSKLTITAYSDSARTALLGSTEVQFNPETLSMKHESVFQGRQGIATSSAQARFAHSRSQLLNVTLIFDGTNVDYFGVELLRAVPTVAERIRKFLQLCFDVNSATHEPSYLKLSWDKGVLGASFDCRLQSADVKYASFNRDGSPLHAELSAVFVEDLDPAKRSSLDRLSSPDLTHVRQVRAGDTLPLLCREIYGSAEHVLRVAEVNNLDDFRVLTVGQELTFPPYSTPGG